MPNILDVPVINPTRRRKRRGKRKPDNRSLVNKVFDRGGIISRLKNKSGKAINELGL